MQKSMACTLDSGSVRCQAVEMVCDRWQAVEVVVVTDGRLWRWLVPDDRL